MRIEVVPPAEVDRWWDAVRPGVEDIKRICREPWRAEYVYSRLIGNCATLFVFLVAGEAKGFAVCETCTDAAGKYLNVWLLHLVGLVDENRIEILHWLDTLARSAGCRAVRFTSPRAWAKLLRGAFVEKAVIYERSVK